MFYIKKIKIYTDNGVTSEISLTRGLNIIYGESNTGKSLILECIDFLMGSKGKNEKNRSDESVSYKKLSKPELKIRKISLCIDVNGNDILLSRDIDMNEIDVLSSVSYIESGVYSIGKGTKKKPPINQVWLRLLGIQDDEIKIAQKADGSPQGLTLRTFHHFFLINETRIFGENSILKNGNGYVKNIPIPTISSLIFLATGKSFAILKNDNELSETAVTTKKSTAKIMFDRNIRALAGLNNSIFISADEGKSVSEINEDINNLLTQISSTEDVLGKALEESQMLSVSISAIDEKMVECGMLKDRYTSLRTQYESDIRRLTFIAEGNMRSNRIPKNTYCPFCNGVIKKEISESYVEAAVCEVEKIEMKINDLRAADADIDREIATLSNKLNELVSQRMKIQTLINCDLQPQIDELRKKMISYTAALEKAKAKEMMDAFTKILKEQFDSIIAEASVTKENPQFNIIAQMSEYMTSMLSKRLEAILKACNYYNFVGARFDESLCDVVVNGSDKMSQGKGFRAFLNSVMAIAVQEWLDDYNLYAPHLLVLDSPILSLKEKEEDVGTEVTTNSMKSGLFEYMVKHQQNRQTIILENQIPDIEYKGVNLIHFTKTEGNGIYGLVSEYRE